MRRSAASSSSRRSRSGDKKRRSYTGASTCVSLALLPPPCTQWPHTPSPRTWCFVSMQVRQQELLLKLLQQQQAVAAVAAAPAPGSPPPLWAGLAKQGLSMKTLLELQLEGERQLHKPPPAREPARATAPNHRAVSRQALCGAVQGRSPQHGSVHGSAASAFFPGPSPRPLSFATQTSPPSALGCVD